MTPTYFLLERLDWADDRASGLIPPKMLDEVGRRGGGRKLLANGQGGYHSSYSVMPPGYRMDRHRHDYDEMVIVLEGGCAMDDRRTELRAHDSVLLPAGFVHGFTCGASGMKLLTIAQGPFKTEMVADTRSDEDAER